MANGIFCGQDKRFYWNIDGNVGPGCSNNVEDVQLVQLGFHCKANNTKRPIAPQEKAAYSLVTPGAPYTGAYGDPLSAAIRVFQKHRGGTQDGHVSVIGSSTGAYAPDLAWMLVALDNNIIDVIGNHWPSVDKHPQCPAALRAAVVRVFARNL